MNNVYINKAHEVNMTNKRHSHEYGIDLETYSIKLYYQSELKLEIFIQF